MTPPSCSNDLWPDTVKAHYDPVKVLGKGGYGSIILAKQRKQEKFQLVAIKMVKASTYMEQEYANREVAVLRELSHPGIVQLIDSINPVDGTAVMVLGYAKGTMLSTVLEKIGAPSQRFGRTVIAQLVDAIAYLHSHAVIHRDIKPENLIVGNIDFTDSALSPKADHAMEEQPDWNAYKTKWHLTVVDFGFARALSPQDVGVEEAQLKSRKSNQALNDLSIDKSLRDDSVHMVTSRHSMTATSEGKSNRHKKNNVDVSRHMVRKLSALGTRAYAAPEVRGHVKETADRSTHPKEHVVLADHVSDYGMISDAFGVGSTARYILTGVPSGQNVHETIANHNNPINKTARWLSKKIQKEDVPLLKKKYRSSSKLSREALHLIKGMTQPNPADRISVRNARLYPYVDELYPGGTFAKKEIVFLKCSQ